MNVCKNCQHYTVHRGVFGTDHICTFKPDVQIDKITGDVKIRMREPWEERQHLGPFDWLFTDKCGLRGRNFRSIPIMPITPLS